MGLRILEGVDGGDSFGQAVLYCSTSMMALPWMFESLEEAEQFLEWFEKQSPDTDFRKVDTKEQEALFNKFVQQSRNAKQED